VTETEKTSKSRGDYASTIRDQHDVNKPTETKFFELDC
jgi:hypothetical protein